MNGLVVIELLLFRRCSISWEPLMSGLPSSRSILDHFSALRDHREQWRVLYPLREVLLLVLCATLSGMEDFVEIRLWGQHRRSEEHTSELQSLMRRSYAVFCLKKKKQREI